MRHVSAWRNIRGHTMEYMQDKVEKYIKDNNITKKHFAEMICVTPSHLYSWLGGKQKFDKTLLKRVRSFLDGERNINNPYVVQKTVANKHRYMTLLLVQTVVNLGWIKKKNIVQDVDAN